jgi:endo-1,4-beta-D-glucanase Y
LNKRALDVLAVVAVVALAGVALFVLTGCGSSSSNSSSTTSSSSASLSPQQRATQSAQYFLNRYVTGDGRVSRLDQGGDTVGEGQAYGMLIAAAIGDKRRFNLIWNWTQKNIQRPDGLLSFLWKNGHVTDPQAASDADVDAARALLVAGCRFNKQSYRQDAIALANAIMKVEVGSATFDGKSVLTAGPWAITPPPITVDPSYFAPRSFMLIERATHDSRWGQLAASAREITGKLMPQPGRLPPDWAHLDGNTPVPIYMPNDTQRPPQFGFDAVRTLVRFAEDPNPQGVAIAARAWPVFQGADPTKLPVEHNLEGKIVGHTLHPVVLVAAAGAASAADQPAAREGLLDAAEELDRHSHTGGTYYGAAWVALGRILLDTKMLDVSCGK